MARAKYQVEVLTDDGACWYGYNTKKQAMENAKAHCRENGRAWLHCGKDEIAFMMMFSGRLEVELK